jgi:hypothetical protein
MRPTTSRDSAFRSDRVQIHVKQSLQNDLCRASLDDLKTEIIRAKRLAIDEDGSVLVWTGGPPSPGSDSRDDAPNRITIGSSGHHLQRW